jgi:hypothetical protein
MAMRYTLILLVLAGCTPPSTGNLYTSAGEPIEIAYIVMSPLCAIFCQTTVSTTGSRIEGTGSASQSTTQTASGSSIQ